MIKKHRLAELKYRRSLRPSSAFAYRTHGESVQPIDNQIEGLSVGSLETLHSHLQSSQYTSPNLAEDNILQGEMELTSVKSSDPIRTPSEQGDNDKYSLHFSTFSVESNSLSNYARTRRPRKLTTMEDANHRCDYCGKLFGRDYNFRAHLQVRHYIIRF
jgi:hypothetical protein